MTTKYARSRGTWVTQLVKRLTLGFSSGHDLRVPELEPCVRLHAGHLLGILSLPPSLSLPVQTLSLKINKFLKNAKKPPQTLDSKTTNIKIYGAKFNK